MGNLTLKQKIVGIVVAILAMFGFGTTTYNLGSISEGSAYNGTSTGAYIAQYEAQIKTSGGVLGSVVVASSSATILTLKDATSTTDISSTTIASFPASATVGTYTFDVAFTRGLMVNIPAGFNGAYVVTSR